jgi:hypothetical protein
MAANSNKQRLNRYVVVRNEPESSGFESRRQWAHDSGEFRVGSASGSGAREAAAEPFATSADLAKKELQS